MSMDEPEEVLRPAEQPQESANTYAIRVVCGNCGDQRNMQIPLGRLISETRCEHCGVVGQLRRSAAGADEPDR